MPGHELSEAEVAAKAVVTSALVAESEPLGSMKRRGAGPFQARTSSDTQAVIIFETIFIAGPGCGCSALRVHLPPRVFFRLHDAAGEKQAQEEQARRAARAARFGERAPASVPAPAAAAAADTAAEACPRSALFVIALSQRAHCKAGLTQPATCARRSQLIGVIAASQIACV